MIKLYYGRVKKSKALKWFDDLDGYNNYYGFDSLPYKGGSYNLVLVDNDDVYILENELIYLEETLNVDLSLLNYIKNNGSLYDKEDLKDYNLKTIL